MWEETVVCGLSACLGLFLGVGRSGGLRTGWFAGLFVGYLLSELGGMCFIMMLFIFCFFFFLLFGQVRHVGVYYVC